MKVSVKTSKGGYDIIIENGSFERLGEYISDIAENKKIFIVTDDTVNNVYGVRLRELFDGFRYRVEVLPHGETTKSMRYLKELYSAMAAFEISRSDLIIALGGGVIGDLTGFAAATFLRGVQFVQIPTTLLAQVDSSVGGKVAIDLPEGKNLAGCFYPPCRVIIDPMLLKTLDERTFNDGMAEVIKYGAIRDEKLFDMLRGDVWSNIEQIILNCVSIKKAIVENDEFDTGERMLLNFGHTFGHVAEKLYDYKKYTHGEAVAIGMLRITEKSERLGVTDAGTAEKLKKVLEKYDLIFDDFTFDSTEAANIMMLDKKSSKDTIKYIMLRHIGEAAIVELPKTDAFLTED